MNENVFAFACEKEELCIRKSFSSFHAGKGICADWKFSGPKSFPESRNCYRWIFFRLKGFTRREQEMEHGWNCCAIVIVKKYFPASLLNFRRNTALERPPVKKFNEQFNGRVSWSSEKRAV